MLTPRFFNEFAVRLPKPAGAVVDALAERGVLAGVPFSRLDPDAGLDDVLLVCATETTSRDDIDALAQALAEELARMTMQTRRPRHPRRNSSPKTAPKLTSGGGLLQDEPLIFERGRLRYDRRRFRRDG